MIFATIAATAGHMLAIDISGQERIRQALLAYEQAHAIGVVILSRRISEAHPRRPQIVVRTLQRMLAGRRVNEQLLAFCDHFVQSLPHKPTVLQALGETLHAMYRQPLPPDSAGIYALAEPTSTITVESPIGEYALVTERAAGKIIRITPVSFDGTPSITTERRSTRIHDGVLISTGDALMIVMRDRVMRTPRTVMLRKATALTYECCPLYHRERTHLFFETRFVHVPQASADYSSAARDTPDTATGV